MAGTVRTQGSPIDTAPDFAFEYDPQVQHVLTGDTVPAHPRLFETIVDDGLARRFRHAASDGQTHAPVFPVVHVAGETSEVVDGLPVVFLAAGQPTTLPQRPTLCST